METPRIGRLSTSNTVHIINVHGLTECQGHQATVKYRKPPKRRLCRVCFGRDTNTPQVRNLLHA